MAYNNNSYSGYNRGYSGGGQSRPLQRSGYGAQQRPTLFTLHMFSRSLIICQI